MTTEQVLTKALDVLGPKGERWCKGRYHTEYGHCMQGAVHRVIPSDYDLQTKCWAAMISVLPPTDGNPIAWFNDDPERTWPEVKAAFLKAIELARAEGRQAEP